MFHFNHLVNWSSLAGPLCMRSIYHLLYKSQIEKHNFSLNIFVSDTNIARNLHLPGLEKTHFSYIRTHTLFYDQILVSVLLKIKEHNHAKKCIIIDVKNYLRGSMTGKMIMHMGRIQAKWGLGCWQVRFVSYCKQLMGLGASNTATETFCNQ